jgi:meiotically up-regulated gene 157 (Mug157) protein
MKEVTSNNPHVRNGIRHRLNANECVVDANDPKKFLRTWYAWGNSSFAECMLDLAERKPHLVF